MTEDFTVHLLQDTDKQKLINGNLQEVDDELQIIDTSSYISPTLVFSAFIALLGSLSAGLVAGYSSPVQFEIMKELDLSIAEYSLFGSISNMGGAIGALVCGRLTDYLGRRRVLGLAALFYIFGWCCISVGQHVWLLDAGRWMSGFALSIDGYAVPIYIAEFTSPNVRGSFVALHALMLTTGGSIAFLLGLTTPWRTLALRGIIPSLVQIFGLFLIPESPRWLMMIGDNEGFESALQRFRGGGIDISQEAANIKVCAEDLHQVPKVTILELFRKKYAYTLMVAVGLAALPMLVGLYGIVYYSASIFESAGFSGFVGNMILAIFQLPSVILGITLMDRCGRRPLLMISAAGLCLGCLLAGFAFVLQDNHLLEGSSPYIAVTGILVYVAAYPIGLGGVSTVIISEIYPLNIKGLCGSISALVTCFSGWLVSYAFNFSIEWSSSGTFFILAGVCVVTLLFVAKLVPETKGKTLEEVHVLMANSRE